MFPYQYKIYADIVRENILNVTYEDGHVAYIQHAVPGYQLHGELTKVAFANGLPALTELFVMGCFLHEGPKFFSFEARDCEALEHFDLDLPVEEYGQPFPTLMVKLPTDYTKNRLVPFECGQHKPTDIIIRHDRSIRRVSILMRMDSTQVLVRIIRLDQKNTVEQAWDESCKLWEGEEKTLDVGKEEQGLSNALTRLALSSCLIAMVYGNRRVGPENPSYAQRLERYLKVAKKSKNAERIDKATWELASLPIKYSFEQEVKLYRTEKDVFERKPSGDQRYLEPHWRRGHYRMQAYGPGYSLHKRIAVPAILVNAHLFLGTASQTQVNYKIQ